VNALLQQFGEHQLVAFILVLARVAPLFVLAPLFSSRLVPTRVRGIIAVALAVGLSPVLSQGRHLPTDAIDIGWLVGKEMLVGLAFAFTLSALFAAVTTAGTFLDTSIGFSFGSIVDPINGTQSSVLQQAYSLVALMVFIAINGDAWVVAGLREDLRPRAARPQPRPGEARGGGRHRVRADLLSGHPGRRPGAARADPHRPPPFGLVSRVVPQLNVFGVGFPAKVTVGLLLIGASLPFVAGWLSDNLQTSVSDALRMLHVA